MERANSSTRERRLMEYLRWILLVIGVILVLLVYVWGRSRKKSMDYSPLDAANDVPSFGARDASDDAWRDGVGPVRVVHRERVDEVIRELDTDELPTTRIEPVATTPETEVETGTEIEESEKVPTPADDEDVEQAANSETGVEESATKSVAEPDQQDIPSDDVVALYIVADRGQELKGEQILSACFAGQLEYGDMKIFHRLDARQKPVFSMANMKEPGWFDYDHMHELKTRGITLFTQLRLCDEPVQALDDMLVCAHTLGSLLSAQLCGPDRQLLNEVTAKSLREKARYFQQQKHGQ